jgi:hypothetical protein
MQMLAQHQTNLRIHDNIGVNYFKNVHLARVSFFIENSKQLTLFHLKAGGYSFRTIRINLQKVGSPKPVL